MSNDADPFGDLTLKVGQGDDQACIRVSSRILTLASPVFTAMLSPRYAEGQGSRQKDWTVSLPEDNPKAMTLVCAILHHQSVDSGQVSYSALGKIAELCDKYDLGEPLSGWVQRIMQSKKSSIQTKEDYVRLLKISCVLGSHDTFWITSFKLIENDWRVRSAEASGPASGPAPPEDKIEMDTAALPDGLLTTIKAQRKSILRPIRQRLEMIIEDPLSRQSPEWSITAVHYLRELQRIRLWPLADISSGTNVKDILWKLKQSKSCVSRDCLCYTLDIPSLLKTIAESEERKMRGLCLSCVKQGRLLSRQGNCMAFYPADCSTPRAVNSVPDFFFPRER